MAPLTPDPLCPSPTLAISISVADEHQSVAGDGSVEATGNPVMAPYSLRA